MRSWKSSSNKTGMSMTLHKVKTFPAVDCIKCGTRFIPKFKNIKKCPYCYRDEHIDDVKDYGNKKVKKVRNKSHKNKR